VEFWRAKPVSLHQDKLRIHVLSATMTQVTEKNPVDAATSSYLRMSTDHTIGRNWIPNNRANIFAGFGVHYQYYRILKDASLVEHPEQHVASAGLTIRGNYFISYRSRLELDSNLDYGYSSGGEFEVFIADVTSTATKAKGFQGRLSVALLVSIF
jgi:hypothetical protein